MAEVLWIGGWASDLSAWRGALESRYPAWRHRFLDAHALLDGKADLGTEAASLPEGGLLAGWSLGSLLLHRALAQGWRPACPVLSISPIFDFCRADGPWPRAAVLRMARRLPREREKVLAEFRAAAWGNSQVTPDLASAWEERARAYGDDALIRGLEALAGVRVDSRALAGIKVLRFLASADDPLSPASGSAAAAAAWRSYPRGHLPFLDYPDILASLFPAEEARP
jgi:hypothetical protein